MSREYTGYWHSPCGPPIRNQSVKESQILETQRRFTPPEELSAEYIMLFRKYIKSHASSEFLYSVHLPRGVTTVQRMRDYY